MWRDCVRGSASSWRVTGVEMTVPVSCIRTFYPTVTQRKSGFAQHYVVYTSVYQPPGRGPVPGPGINYTGPREVLLEFVILVF